MLSTLSLEDEQICISPAKQLIRALKKNTVRLSLMYRADWSYPNNTGVDDGTIYKRFTQRPKEANFCSQVNKSSGLTSSIDIWCSTYDDFQ